MRCRGCKAWIDHSCVIGKIPYVSKKDLFGQGCSFNRKTVMKRMKDLGVLHLLDKERKNDT